jgi:hypothetical protein
VESRVATGRGIWSGGVGRRRFLLLLPLVLALSACSDEVKQTKPPNTLVVTVGDSRAHIDFKVRCNPPGGTAPKPLYLCRTIEENEGVMLNEESPLSMCGAFNPVQIHVSGVWDGKRIDDQVDACSGNGTGEYLWMTRLGNLSFGGFVQPDFPALLTP